MIEFGSVSVDNFKNLQDIGTLVQHSQEVGHPVEIDTQSNVCLYIVSFVRLMAIKKPLEGLYIAAKFVVTSPEPMQ